MVLPITPQKFGAVGGVMFADRQVTSPTQMKRERRGDAVDVHRAAGEERVEDLAAGVAREPAVGTRMIDASRKPESTEPSIGPMVSFAVPQVTPLPLEQWPAV